MKLAADQPDLIVEDLLCERLGTLLHEADQAPDVPVGPQHLAEAMVTAADAAVTASLRTTVSADAWRVLTTLAGVLPYPHAEIASEAITQLRATADGRALPTVPPGPAVAGTVLWTRDRYGSRFAIAAPITTADQPVRWYLWDIDACGHDAFTVHSGYYPTPDAALASWQAGVGPIASAGTDLAPVSDRSLLIALLPAEHGFLRTGGESVGQFTEYHRSKRLAEVVSKAVPVAEAQPGGDLTEATAAVEFAAWLRGGDADQQKLPEDLDELAEELASSWNINEINGVYAACSPHRVALSVLHMRNYYLDEFAEELVALLPGWTRWLATRNATAPDLADRCLPYAHGQRHPQLDRDDDYRDSPDYYARVLE
ncbi:hypothetical protein [Kribbella catacumbae]|uniref:hypothetical protein n=1 Tax=Kribbella catacumbae TaxID=460086 RepID=UPI00039B75C3|nr:hypothetical protein [Kribbella catacumbae]